MDDFYVGFNFAFLLKSIFSLSVNYSPLESSIVIKSIINTLVPIEVMRYTSAPDISQAGKIGGVAIVGGVSYATHELINYVTKSYEELSKLYLGDIIYKGYSVTSELYNYGYDTLFGESKDITHDNDEF